MSEQNAPSPVMMRVYENDKKGATGFFRNRAFLMTAVDLLKTLPRGHINILFHACSVGAEPYSFIAYAAMNGFFQHFESFNILATDIEPSFIAQAQAAQYPSSILNGMNDQERAFFASSSVPDMVTIHPAIKEAVQFIPAASFTDFQTDMAFDAVFVMNALTYVSAQEQTKAINAIAAYNTRFLFTTAFHPDSVKADMVQTGYHPASTNRAQIHNGWGDRITPAPIAPSSPEYSWRIPPYSENIPDYEYRCCAIFDKGTV